MSFINNFEDYCILRELIDENNLLIIVYCNKNNKFYQKNLSRNEWNNTTTNFTIEELEMIFKACIDKNRGYTLKIIENDVDLLLQFNCKELIKTYSWCIKLVEKCNANVLKINEIFENLKTRFCGGIIQDNTDIIDDVSNKASFVQSIQNIYQKKEICEFLNNLESSIKQLFICQNKELQMVPLIAKIHDKKSDFLKYIKISNIQEKSVFTKYVTDKSNNEDISNNSDDYYDSDLSDTRSHNFLTASKIKGNKTCPDEEESESDDPISDDSESDNPISDDSDNERLYSSKKNHKCFVNIKKDESDSESEPEIISEAESDSETDSDSEPEPDNYIVIKKKPSTTSPTKPVLSTKPSKDKKIPLKEYIKMTYGKKK